MTTTTAAPDASPGDGICADAAGQCTLRAATQEADTQPAGSAALGQLTVTHGNASLAGVALASAAPTACSSMVRCRGA